jgi:hypothetical protein
MRKEKAEKAENWNLNSVSMPAITHVHRIDPFVRAYPVLSRTYSGVLKSTSILINVR